jgi:8-oxo-dGTP pyrophosphatase MutT (NUDIX family)
MEISPSSAPSSPSSAPSPPVSPPATRFVYNNSEPFIRNAYRRKYKPSYRYKTSNFGQQHPQHQHHQSPQRRLTEPPPCFSKEGDYKRRYYYRSRNPINVRQVVCSNCNGKGHFFKDCKKPIQSFGVLAWTLVGDDELRPDANVVFSIEEMKTLFKTGKYMLRVCLIQRKHTISFEAFVRGKYNNGSELLIHRDRMTREERESIKTICWEGLYDQVMADKDVRYMQRERRRAKTMYESVNLQEFLDGATETLDEPSWEFPKGRRFSHETDIQCAAREFEEETNIKMTDVIIPCPEEWCDEEFCGTNQRIYKNKYYIALVRPGTKGPFIDPENAGQTSEVKNAKWFSYEDAMSILHHYCQEKRDVLQASYHQVIDMLNS